MNLVKSSDLALGQASHRLQADKNVILAAVKQDGRAIKFVPAEHRDDKEIIMAAVTGGTVRSLMRGHVLQYASEVLRNDKDVVLAAVTRDGSALQFVSEHLRMDRGIIVAAVTGARVISHTGHVLQFASHDLQHDNDVVLAAVKRLGLPEAEPKRLVHGEALRWAADRFFDTPLIM